MKIRLLFVITQFYKGGAEVALLNLFLKLRQEEFEIDFLILDQMFIPNATSLIPEIPSWIHVCNASKREGKLAIIAKIWFKVIRKITRHQLCRYSAYQFVEKKSYDVAISYGEWLSPEFVAKKVNAKRKMIWIHTDIDKASYINDKILFGYDKFYTNYIFVSELSRKSAETKFPIVKGKSCVIHNICNDLLIKNMAKEEIGDLVSYKKPLLITVGNIRPEKNYKRHIQVMKILKENGTIFHWMGIGSHANFFLYQEVKNLILKYQLEDCCTLLGAKKNPYSYMIHADAIVLLSDFESWSLVITEAKLLGIPVIATATSGAKEQIEDGINGIITSFESKEIAKHIKYYLASEEQQNNFRKNLQGYSTNQGLEEFKQVILDMIW